MNNSLGNQFNKFIAAGDFHAANQIIKDACQQDYPSSLINSWNNILLKLDQGVPHPLDSIDDSKVENNTDEFKLGPGLREAFYSCINEYCGQYIARSSIEEIVDLTFNNLNLRNGQILVPDLTCNKPSLNLINYSAHQYRLDCPDVFNAVQRGVIISEIDHFLRSGFLEIVKGRRHTSMLLSYERKKYDGKLLYIVDDYKELTTSDKNTLLALQLQKFRADILSVRHNSVFLNDGTCVDNEQYLYQNISEDHNLCILLQNRTLARSASKWIIDIKLADQIAIFGYTNNNGMFSSVTEYSQANMLTSDITNGCIIVNSIEVLSVIGNLKEYKTAYGFYQALVLQMSKHGIKFCLKPEVLSETNNCKKISAQNKAYWSPFFWKLLSHQDSQSFLLASRTDSFKIWKHYQLSSGVRLCDDSNLPQNLIFDSSKLVLNLVSDKKHTVGIVIPFKDKIHLLKNCIESLMTKREEIQFKVYAINNDSCESETFNALNQMKDKYFGRFVCIDSPGDFNYAKINNEAVNMVEEDYLLFLNNDILIESDYAVTTLLKTHCFYNSIITGSKLLYPSGRIQHNGLALSPQKHIAVLSPFRGQETKANNIESVASGDLHPWDRTHECSAVTAACMLMKKEEFLSLGGFNEEFRVAYNDVDLCLRARAKFLQRPIICSTESRILHLESESRGSDTDIDKLARLYHEKASLVNSHEGLFTKPDKFIGIDPPSDDIYRYIKTNFDRKYTESTSTSKSVSDIDLEELKYLHGSQDSNNKYACIFVHYDKDARITSDCIYHLKKLGDYCDIYFVSSSESLAKKPEQIKKINSICKTILIRKNSGYDFGCWSHVIRKHYSELSQYEGILLANDSNWGPLKDFSDTFNKISKYSSEVDFIGLTSSTSPTWHVQSFFVFYSKNIFSSSYFKQHWFNINVLESKYDIIMNYEVGWCSRLRRLGYKGMSIYGNSSANNPTHIDWKNLLKSNYPYLKKELVRDNPLRIDIDTLPESLLDYKQDWFAHILGYLKRYGKSNSNIAKAIKKMSLSRSKSIHMK